MPTIREVVHEVMARCRSCWDCLRYPGWDYLWCPRCGKTFREADIRRRPADYTECGYCGAVEHMACRGPIPSHLAQLVGELARLRAECEALREALQDAYDHICDGAGGIERIEAVQRRIEAALGEGDDE